MRRWVCGYTDETPRQIFKRMYLICSIGSAFAFIGIWRVHFYDPEMTRMKWIGGALGFLESAAAISLLIVFCTVVEIIGLGIAVLSLHVVHWFLIGFFWKPNKPRTDKSEEQAQKAMNRMYPPLQRKGQTGTPRFHVCLPDDLDPSEVDFTEKKK